MSDETREVFEALKQDKKDRHQMWYNMNRISLDKSGIKYRHAGTAFIVREPKRADFYPHTGRWKSIDEGNKMYRGGADKFIKWLQSV